MMITVKNEQFKDKICCIFKHERLSDYLNQEKVWVQFSD